MAKWLKRLVGIVGLVVLLIIIAVVSLPFIIDPNDFKEDIAALAQKQGIQLDLNGTIGWQFFPTLGLSIADVRVAPLIDPQQPLAQLQEMTAAVAVMPLFKTQIRVKELRVTGAKIDLVVDKQGHGNWESLTNTATDPTPPPAAETGSGATQLDVNIASIRFNQAQLRYDDQASGQLTLVRDFDLQISDVNTEQRPFPLRLDLIVENPALSKPLRLALTSQLAVNAALNQFAITEGTLQLPDASIDIGLATTANIENEAQFEGRVNASIDNLATLFAVLGIDKPVTQDPGVLSRANISTQFQGTPQHITLSNLSTQLDDTHLTGKAELRLPTNQNVAVAVTLQGDQMNVDRYLAPTAEETTGTNTTAATDSPLPLEALRGTDAQLNFQFGEVIVNKMPIRQLDLAVNGKQGLWQLQKFNADFYQGKLLTTGQLDARGKQATANVNADLKQVDLLPLLTDVAEVTVLRGLISANITASTQAATSQQLFNNLQANITFHGDDMVVDGLNVEEKYCEVVRQVHPDDTGNASEPTTWPQQTDINDVTGRIVMNNAVITVEQLRAQVAYLQLGTKGKLDLNDQAYEISLPLTVTNNKTSDNGCLIASDFLINREINVLGCKGNLAELTPAKQCGLRSGAIGDLAKQALRYNAEKKVAPKVEEKKEEVREKVRDRLKDLLNRQ